MASKAVVRNGWQVVSEVKSFFFHLPLATNHCFRGLLVAGLIGPDYEANLARRSDYCKNFLLPEILTGRKESAFHGFLRGLTSGVLPEADGRHT